MARAAAAPPSTGVSKRHHPPYKEMILSAVAGLKERKGSSRKAIAKFISSSYSDLPATPDALLSTHIRRLRDQGSLLMLGHSYKLAAPPPTSAPLPKRRPGRPPKNPGPPSARNEPPRPAEKRKPGRPPKAGLGDALPTVKRRPGRPPMSLLSLFSPAASKGPRRRGRPPKVLLSGSSTDAAVVLESQKTGRPRKQPLAYAPDSKSRRKPGRPHKVPLLGSSANAVVFAQRRKPGRPPKQPSVSLALAPDLAGRWKPGRPYKVLLSGSLTDAAVLAQRRKPGRPPKQLLPSSALAPDLMGRRKPGRPQKVLSLGSSGNADVLTLWRKPGRPPKQPSALAVDLMGRRKPGRPPKSPGSSSSLKGVNMRLAKGRKPGRPPKQPQVALALLPDFSRSTTTAVEGLISLSSIKKPKPDVAPAAGLTVSTEKRKRGRPKKVQALPSQVAVAGVEPGVATIKKRGRPPKSSGSPVSATVEEMADTTEKMAVPDVIPPVEWLRSPAVASVLSHRRKPCLVPKKPSVPPPLAPELMGRRKPRRSYKVLFSESSADAAVLARRWKPCRLTNQPPAAPSSAPVLMRRRKPGRPGKVLSLSSSLNAANATALTKKQKPGWPPKQPQVALARCLDCSRGTTTSPMEVTIHLSRIKEPKIREMPTTSLTASTLKRKPGRPKKVLPLSLPSKGAVFAAGSAVDATRKQGRLPNSGGPLGLRPWMGWHICKIR